MRPAWCPALLFVWGAGCGETADGAMPEAPGASPPMMVVEPPKTNGDDGMPMGNGQDASLDPDPGPKPDAHSGGQAPEPDASDTPDAAAPEPEIESPPALLSQTGLYADIGSETLADGVVTYRPRFELWSDGAEKRRWFYLPEGTQIDTSDMDKWRFPVGTKAWKEFTRDGVRVETRLVEKTDEGWELIAYIWREDGSDADSDDLGMENARGTPHDVPGTTLCNSCHLGQPDRLLGISALQLWHDDGDMTVQSLMAEGRLTNPPAGPPTLPSDPTALNALGGMHANCGSCHTPEHLEVFDKADGLILTLPYGGSTDPTQAPAYMTAVGVAVDNALGDLPERIAAGAPDQSQLFYRMELPPGDEDGMPPTAVELPNTELITAVRTWIEMM